MTRRLPLEGATGRQLFIEGAPAETAREQPRVWSITISPSYFETLGVGLVRGRAFHDRDGLPGYETVIVNQRLVDIHFPGTDPIGKRIGLVAGGVLLAVGSSKLFAGGRSSGLMVADLLIAALILGSVSLLAALLPTIRALRVNPAVALRCE